MALEAREAAKLDAAMVSTVLDPTEFEAVEAALRKTATAVIGEIETEALEMITAAGAQEALRSALGRYGDLRPAALEAGRAAIEAEGPRAIELARARLKDRYQSQVLGETRTKIGDYEAAVIRAQADYEPALERADKTLDSALTVFQSLPPKKRERRRNMATLEAALARHAVATRAARSRRVGAIDLDLYLLTSTLTAELNAAMPADFLAKTAGETLAAGGDIALDIAEHRERRRHFDTAFQAALQGEYRAKFEGGVPERVEELVEKDMGSVEEEVARRAESGRKQLVDRIPHLVDRAEALRQLEADVRNGLFRAAGSGSAIDAPVESTPNG